MDRLFSLRGVVRGDDPVHLVAVEVGVGSGHISSGILIKLLPLLPLKALTTGALSDPCARHFPMTIVCSTCIFSMVHLPLEYTCTN